MQNFKRLKLTQRMPALKRKSMKRSQIRFLLPSVLLALLTGVFSTNLASANENPPPPIQINGGTLSALSFVGMSDVGGMPTLQAVTHLSSFEQTRVRMAFPSGTSDRAVKIQVLSRATLPGSHMTLVSLKLSGIDLWNLSPVDLNNIRFLEISHQNLSAKTGKGSRNIHWLNVSPMPASGLHAGTLSGYHVQNDGSILVQFKKSNISSVTESSAF